MFFSTLNDLTDLDINVLRMYHFECNENIYTLMNEKNLSIDQINLVKEKLLRNGLLDSKNDEQKDDNLEEVVRYVTDLAKQMNFSSNSSLNKDTFSSITDNFFPNSSNAVLTFLSNFFCL